MLAAKNVIPLTWLVSTCRSRTCAAARRWLPIAVRLSAATMTSSTSTTPNAAVSRAPRPRLRRPTARPGSWAPPPPSLPSPPPPAPAARVVHWAPARRRGGPGRGGQQDVLPAVPPPLLGPEPGEEPLARVVPRVLAGELEREQRIDEQVRQDDGRRAARRPVVLPDQVPAVVRQTRFVRVDRAQVGTQPVGVPAGHRARERGQLGEGVA